MATIDAVVLRGGPCDGERPEPIAGTTFPDDLDAITVCDFVAGVEHRYEVIGAPAIGEDGISRAVLEFRRTVPRGA
ncbi:MAG TPA: hypothetical protein VGV67_00925 [Solirubrobacteraceae bacterium]|nr:hypothetical protein [Solirubrobacteraceae bacterium]